MDPRDARLAKALASQERARGAVQGAGVPSMNYNDAGPPVWSRPAWEAFRAQYGFYPFGPQGDGSTINPPNFDNAPAWVYELMGLRQPPVTVNAGLVS